MKKLFIALCMTLITSCAFAEESTTNQDELGMDQKLERVYDLYRKGSVVSLKQNEVQMGFSVDYSTSSNTTFDLAQSTRSLVAQTFIGRGVGDGMEASILLPYVTSSQRIETSSGTLSSQTISGFGDPSVRLIKMFPMKDTTVAGIFSASIPAGDQELSSKQVHTSLGVSVGKVLRPAFVSGGLTFEQDWKSHTSGIGYSTGLGFFLNHALSVGVDVSGVAAIKAQPGTPRDAMSFGIKVAYQTDSDFGVMVSTNFGIATNTPSATLAVSTYWRF